MTGKELYLQLKRAGLENVPLVAANPYLDDSDPWNPWEVPINIVRWEEQESANNENHRIFLEVE